LVTIIAPAQIASAWVFLFVTVEGGGVTLAALTSDSARFLLAILLCPVIAVVMSIGGSTVDRLKGQ
ncbi:MAG: hypothetical protein ACRCSP_03170, partial [Rhodoglobus sp.]